MRGSLLAMAIVFAGPVAAAKTSAPPTPLFASDAPINITIQGHISDLVSNR